MARRADSPRRHTALLAPVLLFLAVTGAAGAAETLLVPRGSTWAYRDNGADLGTAWRDSGFDHSSWSQGPAELGYGDGGEATVVSYGADPNLKFVTTYFRHTFQASGVAAFAGLILRLERDDGAVVYLNGAEVHRGNMPVGPVSFNTLASSAVGGADESRFFETQFSPAALREGANVLAVEIHQSSRSSTDIGFDLELAATDTVDVTRGPYLQLGTETSVVVRWRTSAPTPSRVVYGTSPANLDSEVDDSTFSTEHELRLQGLAPATTYYYAVGTAGAILAGGDSAHSFVTAPPAGARQPLRVWVLGDSGTANGNQAAVRDSFLAWNGSRHTDLWLMLGDNAYASGTDVEFQAAVFDMYPSLLRSSVLWPTLGNHDGVAADSATQTGPYYDMFSLPRAAEAGGVASGTEAYYSFDWGNVHFVCLESSETDRVPPSAMLDWLEDDLLANHADWTVAYFHHPPYTKGTHNSDTEGELMQMRQYALPILESFGVDLVLAGHSHTYERSFLIDGHYGTSATWNPAVHLIDGGNGRPSGDGAYAKADSGPAPHLGTVYVVAGTSGQLESGGTLAHPVMMLSMRRLGSLVLDVDGERLDASFLDSTGAVADTFTIVKGAQAGPTPTPTSTATPTPTRTAIPSPTATPTRTATPTPSRTATPLPTATPTATHTVTPSRTPTQLTPTSSATPPPPPAATPTATSTAPPLASPAPSATATGTAASPIVLTATGRLAANGSRRVDLRWTPIAPGKVDLYRNGKKFLSTKNDGFHKGINISAPGSWTFQLCLAGTSTCSNTSIVVFQ
jgi:hypothetical protein